VSDVNDYVAGDVNTIDDGYEDEDVNESCLLYTSRCV